MELAEEHKTSSEYKRFDIVLKQPKQIHSTSSNIIAGFQTVLSALSKTKVSNMIN